MADGVTIKLADLGFYEPMRKNWFIVVFYDVDTENQAESALSIACKTCTIPKLTTAINEVHRVNEIVYVPGKSSFDTISLSFYDYIHEASNTEGAGNKIESAGEALYNWQSSIHNVSTGAQGAKKAISKLMGIFQVDPSGNVVRTWTVHNVWPTEVTFDDLDAESGDTLKVTASFRYDWATVGDSTTSLGQSDIYTAS